MDKNKKINIVVFIICLAIIIVVGILSYQYRDTLFKSVVNVTYPDDCVETYVNGEMITEECLLGRELVKENKNLYNNGINT